MARALSLAIDADHTNVHQTVICAILWDLIDSISNSITNSDKDNNLFDYLGVPSSLDCSKKPRDLENIEWLVAKLWESFTEVLMEQGIYQGQFYSL